jgi:hypothetical protein
LSLIRSLQFFWPKDNFNMTVVLDDTVYSTDDEREKMTTEVKCLFHHAFAPGVSVAYNPLSDTTMYGAGWLMQQLIMLWADNFTDAEYIGFVDDDTIFTRVIHADELFDPQGRPRAIVRHASTTSFKMASTTHYSFQKWPTLINGMNYFPIIVKRSELRSVREAILQAHPEFSYFDEFYIHLVQLDQQTTTERTNNPRKPCQFCMLLDYAFRFHPDDYRWHFEESVEGWGQRFANNPAGMKKFVAGGQIARERTPEDNGVTLAMLEPFPRVAIHGTALFQQVQKLRNSKTPAGRQSVVTSVLREGYCYSLPPSSRNTTSNNLMDQQRCRNFGINDNIYIRGEWNFEQQTSFWFNFNKTAVAHAHAKSMERNPTHHHWNAEELAALF